LYYLERIIYALLKYSIFWQNFKKRKKKKKGKKKKSYACMLFNDLPLRKKSLSLPF